MNMSLKDIFQWLLSLDFPSISSIWNWLITVPWWLSLITLCFFWLMAKALVNLTWNTYVWLSNHSYGLGEWVRYWSARARNSMRQVVYRTRSFGRWLLHLLAIR